MRVCRAQLGSSLVETGANGTAHNLAAAQPKHRVACGIEDPVRSEVLILQEKWEV